MTHSEMVYQGACLALKGAPYHKIASSLDSDLDTAEKIASLSRGKLEVLKKMASLSGCYNFYQCHTIMGIDPVSASMMAEHFGLRFRSMNICSLRVINYSTGKMSQSEYKAFMLGDDSVGVVAKGRFVKPREREKTPEGYCTKKDIIKDMQCGEELWQVVRKSFSNSPGISKLPRTSRMGFFYKKSDVEKFMSRIQALHDAMLIQQDSMAVPGSEGFSRKCRAMVSRLRSDLISSMGVQ